MTMTALTYCINTTLISNGSTSKVDYCPTDNDVQLPGSISSISEYRRYLSKNLSTGKLQLYVIGKNGKSISITNDEELKKCVSHLPARGVLSVSAVEDDSDQSGKSHTRPRSREAGKKASKAKQDEPKIALEESLSDTSEDSSILAIEAKKSTLQDIVERFGVTSDDGCYHCDTTTWKTKRYRFKANPSYSLCEECYKDLSEERKQAWITMAGGLHWKHDVPEAPLSVGSEDEDRVRHLQYLLTRLGFMKLSATNKLVGSFQGQTALGVRKFRTKHVHVGAGGNDTDMDLYDEKTAKQLRKVVRAYRKKGHKYI